MDDPQESLEKWPPGWADYDWSQFDQDDFDENWIKTKRTACITSLVLWLG